MKTASETTISNLREDIINSSRRFFQIKAVAAINVGRSIEAALKYMTRRHAQLMRLRRQLDDLRVLCPDASDVLTLIASQITYYQLDLARQIADKKVQKKEFKGECLL